MGLDIYAGPLCRYWAGDWETILQQQSSIPVTIVRPKPPLLERLKGLFRPKPTAQQWVLAITKWRDELAAANAFAPATECYWPESMDVEYQTDKPSHAGWEAVTEWAASLEQSAPFHHLCKPELWLPVDFDEVFEAEAPVGHRFVIGSTHRLFAEMQRLNAETWNAADEQIGAWNWSQCESAEDNAKWGFAIWYALAKFAHENRTPMILDY